MKCDKAPDDWRWSIGLTGRTSVFALCVLSVLATLPLTVRAAEQAEWQGFQGDAGHSGYTASILPAAFQPKWMAQPQPPPRSGRPTAVVASDRLIISDLSPTTIAACRHGHDPEEADDFAIMAYDRRDGSQVWRIATHGMLVGSPHVADGTVYATIWDCPDRGNKGEDSTLAAIDVRSGTIVWQKHFSGVLAGPPVAAEGLVFLPGREMRALLAYDGRTGASRWEAPLQDASRFTIAAPSVLGDTVAVVDAGHIYAFDLATGTERWRVDTDGKGIPWQRFHGTPVAADGMVMVVGQSRPPPPTKKSRISFEAYDIDSGAFLSGLTLADRDWTAIPWGVSYHAGRAFISAIWFDAAGSSPKGIVAFDVVRGREAWRAPLGTHVFAPAIDGAGHLLVTGTLGGAWVLDAGTGATTWTRKQEFVAKPWVARTRNGVPDDMQPPRMQWLPDRWGTGVDGSPVLLDSLDWIHRLPPIIAGDLVFGVTRDQPVCLVAHAPDTTPPSAQIILRPEGGNPTPLIDSFVKGTAYDRNLKSWKLQYGRGTSPESWITLYEDTKPAQGHPDMLNYLGSWQKPELEAGAWSLRLEVTDATGLISTATTEMYRDLADPAVVIDWPRDGMTLDPSELTIRGTASDDFAVKEVTVAIAGGLAHPAEGTEAWTFAYTPSGSDAGKWITIEATAKDTTGHLAKDQVRVRLTPLRVQVADQGRRLISNYPIFVSPTLGRDHDGLLDEWEDAAIKLTEAVFVLDEEEDWLTVRSAQPVATFVRVRPYVPGPYVDDTYTETPIDPHRDLLADPPPYIVFEFVVRWAADYGRFGFLGHDIDTEKYSMAWHVVDSRTVELRYVFTSAHGNPNAHHAVWSAWDTTCNVGDVANLWNEAEWEPGEYDHSEVICGRLEFDSDQRLVLYVSEDKHAIYPSEDVCETTTLAAPLGPSVHEDCGWQPSSSPLSDSHWTDSDFAADPRYRGGGRWLLDAINAGDLPYLLVRDGDMHGLIVPIGALSEGTDKPPQNLRRAMAARYRIEFRTAERTADLRKIFLTLIGEDANASPMEIYALAEPPRHTVYAGRFQSGGTDILYGVEEELGDLNQLLINVYSAETAEALRLDWVRITEIETGKIWQFPGSGWMNGSPVGPASLLDASGTTGDNQYRVSILTGDRPNAGTDAAVTLNLVAADGAETGPLVLDTPGWNDFERNSLDTVTVSSPVDITELSSAILAQDGSGDSPGWYLREMRIRNLASQDEWVFYPERWLADDEGGRSATLTPALDCGVAEYRIKILTSGIANAGTNANVFVNLRDSGGCQTGDIRLDSVQDNFEVGGADEFFIRGPNVAEPEQVLLRHDNSGDNPGWHVSSIVVENLTMNWKEVFNPDVWIEGNHLCWASTGTCP